MNFKAAINNLFGTRRVSSLIYKTGTIEVFTAINVSRAIDAFQNNIAVYSIIMRDAEKFGVIPRYLYDASQKEEKAKRKKKRKPQYKADYADELYENSDLVDLLNRPNEYESQDAFFTKVRAYYKDCGEAFIWLNRGDTLIADEQGQLSERSDDQVSQLPVLEMYVLPSDCMSIIPDEFNVWGVSGYVLDLGGQRVRFRKVDVIHWKNVSLKWNADSKDHLRGMSPLKPGADTLQQNIDSTRSAVRMYQNDGAKGLLTNETYDKLTPEQQTTIKSIVNAKINNQDQKGAVATLQGKWEYHDLGKGSTDLQLLEGKKITWQELCFLMGVPYEFFDSQTTFANKEQAQKSWLSNTIIPASKQLDGELNRVLLKAFGLEGKAFIACDYSELPEMQKDMSLLATALSTAWWLSPNQKLEIMGEEQRDEEEFNEPWIPSGLTPLSQMNDQNEMNMITQDLANRGLANQNGKDQ